MHDTNNASDDLAADSGPVGHHGGHNHHRCRHPHWKYVLPKWIIAIGVLLAGAGVLAMGLADLEQAEMHDEHMEQVGNLGPGEMGAFRGRPGGGPHMYWDDDTEDRDDKN